MTKNLVVITCICHLCSLLAEVAAYHPRSRDRNIGGRVCPERRCRTLTGRSLHVASAIELSDENTLRGRLRRTNRSLVFGTSYLVGHSTSRQDERISPLGSLRKNRVFTACIHNLLQKKALGIHEGDAAKLVVSLSTFNTGSKWILVTVLASVPASLGSSQAFRREAQPMPRVRHPAVENHRTSMACESDHVGRSHLSRWRQRQDATPALRTGRQSPIDALTGSRASRRSRP